MYYYFKGTVVDIKENYIVIEVKDVAYLVYISNPSDYVLFEYITLYVHQVVREDEIYLVGFKSLEDKDFFMKLIEVKGIGPKTALQALSGISVNDFILAIEQENMKILKKLPGIGPKAAGQIILDLKGKIVSIPTKVEAKSLSKEKTAAKQALMSLGFKTKDIEEFLIKEEEGKLETEYIKAYLKLRGNANG